MTATLTTQSTRRELDHRSSDGIDVTLWWNPGDDALYVTVLDSRGDSFELVVEPDVALDVFNHPYAFRPPRDLRVIELAT
jgi:hypothetical protein